MEKFKIKRVKGFTTKGTIRKAEEFLNNLEKTGQCDVISVSFYSGAAYITIKLK